MSRFLTPLLLLFVLGCSAKPENFTEIDPKDERMNSAMAGARASVAEFRSALENPPADAMGFTVKKGFQIGDDPEALEHI